MRFATRFSLWPVLVGLLLAACSSPPKPPTVDESMKRPVNSQTAVELQVCKNDLVNTRILATESARLADATAAALANSTARQQILAAIQALAAAPASLASPSAAGAALATPAPGPLAVPVSPMPSVKLVQANLVHMVRFEFGSARVQVPTDLAPTLIADAKSAPMVLLRGRTDGDSDSVAESRMARDRAAAMRDYLVSEGVDTARIRTSYQPSGDHVADNATAAGRNLNRRVEIELYRALPLVVGVGGGVAALRAAAIAQP